MPSIISGITLSIISIIGYSAMAGAVGAGGVGAVALTYGYQRFDNAVMIYTVITLIIIVQLLHGAGNLVSTIVLAPNHEIKIIQAISNN